MQTALLETIQELMESRGNIDPDRMYVTGHSMGALGVWGIEAIIAAFQ